MNAVSILLLLAVAALVGYAVYRTYVRSRKGSSCCGSVPEKVRRIGAADRDRSHYPHRAQAQITQMTCDNCAARVENSLNAIDGIWAQVRIDSRNALIRSRQPIDEALIRSAVHQAGYGVGDIKIEC